MSRTSPNGYHEDSQPKDGSTLYFVSRPYNAALWQLPLKEPYVESPVLGLPNVRTETLWTLTTGGIYYVPANERKKLYFFSFATRASRQVFENRGEFGEGLSVSPDGRWLLYSQAEDIHSSIMLAKYFR